MKLVDRSTETVRHRPALGRGRGQRRQQHAAPHTRRERPGGIEVEQAHKPDLVYVVNELDAPWKVAGNAAGEQYLLVRHGTPVTVPLVNVINDLAAQRTMLSRLRTQMNAWGAEPVSAVPQQVHRQRGANEPAHRHSSATSNRDDQRHG